MKVFALYWNPDIISPMPRRLAGSGPLSANLIAKQLHQLQTVQNAEACLFAGLNNRERITHSLHYLYWPLLS